MTKKTLKFKRSIE